jgi:hypothetical protein
VIYVLIEVRRQPETSLAQRTWGLLSDVYGTNLSLSNLSDDRRKTYAIELLSLAWKAREKHLLEQQHLQLNAYRAPPKPAFLAELENKLEKHVGATSAEQTGKRGINELETSNPSLLKKPIPVGGLPGQDLLVNDIMLNQFDLDSIAEINFDSVDWSFWGTV